MTTAYFHFRCFVWTFCFPKVKRTSPLTPRFQVLDYYRLKFLISIHTLFSAFYTSEQAQRSVLRTVFVFSVCLQLAKYAFAEKVLGSNILQFVNFLAASFFLIFQIGYYSSSRKIAKNSRRQILTSRSSEAQFLTSWFVCNFSTWLEFLLNSLNLKFLIIWVLSAYGLASCMPSFHLRACHVKLEYRLRFYYTSASKCFITVCGFFPIRLRIAHLSVDFDQRERIVLSLNLGLFAPQSHALCHCWLCHCCLRINIFIWKINRMNYCILFCLFR